MLLCSAKFVCSFTPAFGFIHKPREPFLGTFWPPPPLCTILPNMVSVVIWTFGDPPVSFPCSFHVYMVYGWPLLVVSSAPVSVFLCTSAPILLNKVNPHLGCLSSFHVHMVYGWPLWKILTWLNLLSFITSNSSNLTFRGELLLGISCQTGPLN